MKQYDLHIHTNASPCSGATPASIVEAAVERNLDGIAITDHDTQTNVEAVQRIAPDHLMVIPGVEVTTTEGHLLALYVDEAPPQAEPQTVVDFVHELGGVAVLAHPFDELRQTYDSDLTTLAAAVDGIEVRNSRCLFERYNRRAESFATTHDLTAIAGSDAHFPWEIGRATTECKTSLRAALKNDSCTVRGRGRYLTGHVATKVEQFRSYRFNRLS
ncbi:PHP domain-containing protein [Halorussus salinus]|uniref:PHP domain-containing protein n=1 Tax=Halorussus salinus TaxID=1364935 RepID=UPI001092DAFF|nr:PHP domain-containing protein [Halorussus salinus]